MSNGGELRSLGSVANGLNRHSYQRIGSRQNFSLPSKISPTSVEEERDREWTSNAYGFPDDHTTYSYDNSARAIPSSAYTSRPFNNAHISEVADAGIFSTWRLEAVACLVALAALIAIIVTAYRFQEQPLPNWPQQITMNTMISIYVVVLRIAAGFILPAGLGQLRWMWYQTTRSLYDLSVYDDSTRGPLGSLRLLMFLYGRQVFACLGALITITMLFVDPFTQQMVSPYACNRPDSNLQASLPRTSVYYGEGFHDGAGSVSVDLGTQAALNTGVFAQNATQVKPNCPSGNCTFPETFNTIGFCHSCSDVTSRLTVTHNLTDPNNNPDSEPLNVTLLGDGYTILSLNTSNLPQVYMPGKLMMLGASARSSPANLEAFTVAFVFGQQAFNASGQQVEEDSLIGATAKAFTCAFNPCVKTIKAEVKLGILSEEIVATYDGWSSFEQSGGYTQNMVDLTCLNDEQKRLLSTAGYHFGTSDTFIPYNVSIMRNGSQQPDSSAFAAALTTTIPTECMYTSYYIATMSLLRTMIALFSGGISPQTGSYLYSPQGPAPLLHFMSEGNTLQSINSSMSRVIESLTNHIRESEMEAYNISKSASGQGEATMTCIHIRWGWIAYAASNVGALIVFLIAVVWQTGSGPDRCQHNFKSSALALVCTGLDKDVRDDVDRAAQSGRYGELVRVSKRVFVKYLPSVGKFTKQT